MQQEFDRFPNFNTAYRVTPMSWQLTFLEITNKRFFGPITVTWYNSSPMEGITQTEKWESYCRGRLKTR